jgi:hypothetical protein
MKTLDILPLINTLSGFRNTGELICAFLAFSVSMASGLSYPACLVQVTLFYQYAAVHFPMLIPRS